MTKIKNSLVFKLVLGTTFLMVILFSVLIISNVYSLYLVKSSTVDSAMNAMKIYINNMDNNLNNGTRDLNEIISSADDMAILRSDDESRRYFAFNRLLDILANRINNNKNVDAFIIYTPVHNTFLATYSSKVTGKEKIEMTDYVKQGLSTQTSIFGGLWSTVEIDKTIYFIKMYHFTDTMVAACIKADTLMSFIGETATQNEELFVLTDFKGKPLSIAGNKEFTDITYPLPNDKAIVNNVNTQYMIITTSLGKSNARLSTIIKERSVFIGLNLIQRTIAILGIISLIIMPFIIYYLKKEIINPINRLIEGTRQVEQGNLEYQVESMGHSGEFETLNRSFNSMVKEIKALKIAAYEEKIELQKSKLRYLQMQIRPHFFLNAITTIHSFTYKNKNEEIRAFIDALSMHLRYMFKGGLIKVTIKEELEHVKNYISMQEIKFPDSVFYVFDVEQGIDQEKIPQFLIHTFVENSFKHAMTLEETLSIFIKIQFCKFEGTDTIKIVIEDSGEGFPQTILDKVNSDNAEASDGHKIGISNIKRTLNLLYGKNNLLKISNVEPMGARIVIFIPMEKGD